VTDPTLVRSEAVTQWCADAVATPYQVARVDVEGAVVRARCWGPPGPGIVLIHGGAAHAGWWDHIGPVLATTRRVVAVDLSGHGDSDRRTNYGGFTMWAREVIAVAAAGGIVGEPYLVGHSMGGYVALTAGFAHPAAVAGLLVIDSPIPANAPAPARAVTRQRDEDAMRRYPSREAALARFRFVPPDPYVLPYIGDHVAEESIIERPEGWTWKFDRMRY
jgi:pimeloyl-ACP methyl ester carboxylesterase